MRRRKRVALANELAKMDQQERDRFKIHAAHELLKDEYTRVNGEVVSLWDIGVALVASRLALTKGARARLLVSFFFGFFFVARTSRALWTVVNSHGRGTALSANATPPPRHRSFPRVAARHDKACRRVQQASLICVVQGHTQSGPTSQSTQQQQQQQHQQQSAPDM